MKFARYLEDTQTPEWKKAYIDYRGLKKHITSIRRWQAGFDPLPSSTIDEIHPVAEAGSKPARARWSIDDRFCQKPLSRLSMPASIRSRPNSHLQPLPLYAILLKLPPIHTEFFAYLDEQLAKIDRFYSEREKEARSRSKALESQLRELEDHRKIFFGTSSNDNPHWPEILKSNFQFLPGSQPLNNPKHMATTVSTLKMDVLVPRITIVKSEEPNNGIQAEKIGYGPNEIKQTYSEEDGISFTDCPVKSTTIRDSDTMAVYPARYPARLDPQEYRYARKKLKKAMQEHYRGLEVLDNYRILNLTGFRKVLKKYQKATKIQAQQAYIKEKVETSAFASSASVSAMLRQAEELFAAQFGGGDKKRALARLRPAFQRKSFHSSSLKSGIALGFALPVFVSGIYQSYQPQRRAEIPAWDILLFIYSIFLVPVLFSLLIGVNLWIWSYARINYVFIFDLDVRTRLDYRQYFELPAILLATLACAFWLSFSNIVFPTAWPMIWLGFTFLMMLNPIPVLFKPSRWWLIRSVGELFISGLHKVEFIDFWMGDQFCSLLFTMSNLYFIFCTYAHNFSPTAWQKCGTDSKLGWAMSFVLAMLPLLARSIQSLRRYVDSNLMIHLINGGKYASGIAYYFTFFLWRYHGASRHDAYFIMFCFFGTIYAVYSCAWDCLMDWSFFKSGSKHPLLRSDLIYPNAIPFYYFALISNILMKFNWVLYIPNRGPSMIVRTFIAAMLEMLRRWQWNFYRLENEHLGNMDQYRVTREMPLPYQIDEVVHGDDGDEDSVSREQWLPPRHSSIRHSYIDTAYDDESCA